MLDTRADNPGPAYGGGAVAVFLNSSFFAAHLVTFIGNMATCDESMSTAKGGSILISTLFMLMTRRIIIVLHLLAAHGSSVTVWRPH
jgi:hypothetical protein